MTELNMSLEVGLALLRNEGAVRVRIEYNWYNDEGEIQGLNAEDAQGQTVDIPPTLFNKLENWFYQNHEGGYGSFDIDLLNNAVIKKVRFRGED